MTDIWQGRRRKGTISTHILTRRMTVREKIICTLSIFQLTSSRGGWRRFLIIELSQKYFNSHPHEEDDPGGMIWKKANYYFNSHPHEEDDMAATWIGVSHMTFQLTSSRGGWRRPIRIIPKELNFNSHPHEEDDGEVIQVRGKYNISTHILTRRMTIRKDLYSFYQKISTHILTRRMT